MERNEMKHFDNGGDDRRSTVGKALTEHQVINLDHPLYSQFSNAVEHELTKISERETLRRSTAQPLVYTSALGTEDQNRVATTYPEFTLKVLPLNTVVHSLWNAYRVCANEWLAVTTEKYALDVVHYGGSTMCALAQRRRRFHVEYDPCDSVQVHENHRDMVDTHRLYGDYVKAQSEYGVLLPRVEYDDFIRGQAYGMCSKPHACVKKAGALCVDLSVTDMSPEQVAMAMIQHGAELCHGFFSYHPSMLVQDEGALGNSGVGFKRRTDKVLFTYPEGRAGAAAYSLDNWARWLASHTFSVGEGYGAAWFQLELLKHRDCFMFFRMVKVDKPHGAVQIRHALDLVGADEYVLVRSWRLRAGFGSDPHDDTAWEPHNFLVPTRVERRVREFAMQLDPKQFSRYAIKKQVRIVNNRWVVNGTTVVTAAPLEPGQVEDFTTAVFVRAFVDRYESSQLAAEMMASLQRLAGFRSFSRYERMEVIGRAALSAVYSSVSVRVASWFEGFLSTLRMYVDRGASGKSIVMENPPRYTTLVSEANSWRASFGTNYESVFLQRPVTAVGTMVSVAGPGGSLLNAVRNVVGRPAAGVAASAWRDVVRICTSVVDMREGVDDKANGTLAEAAAGNMPLDSASNARYELEVQHAVREAEQLVGTFKRADDPDPVYSLNQLYLEAFPDVANQAMEFDTFSLSLDPQDRVLAAPYMKMPNYFGVAPVPRSYYRSKLNALNVPKRQNTGQELLTAIAARNLSAPAISQPQDSEVMVRDVWDNFVRTMCVDNARQLLLEFQSDPVSCAAEALADWQAKAKPEIVQRAITELREFSLTVENTPVSEYIAMLKSDVKPTLSNKPLREVTAPQVIVYHERKALNALYSSIFRVLVRRFLALLRPGIHVNLLKDSRDIEKFVTANHPFGESGLQYLENDFSKYDKSQSEFAFMLEEYVFAQLGMNERMLEKWVAGHVECSIRSVTTGLSLHVLYQRKSGDATTAFGNVILNVLSVAYAYKGTEIIWAVFMGDDSTACARVVNADDTAVRVMAEIFNLTAKYYLTAAPYFASNFITLDSEKLQAKLVPDPIKRIERLSMHVAADEPQWRERHISFVDAMAGYCDVASAAHLAVVVPQRYEVSEGFVRGASQALGTLVGDFGKFRGLWETEAEMIQA